jgi:hypothetical protein
MYMSRQDSPAQLLGDKKTGRLRCELLRIADGRWAILIVRENPAAATMRAT